MSAGGTLVVVLAVVGIWLKIKRRLKLSKSVAALKGQVVVITGASSGLGEACARVFYCAGCNVVLCARRTAELNRVKTELEQLPQKSVGGEIKIVTFDMSDLPNIPAAMTQVLSCFGRVDVVINNAGLSYRGMAADTSLDVDIAVMNVNYFAQVAVTRALLPHMIMQRRGHIVAVGSVQSKLGLPCRSAYGASKHALQCFFDSLRAELAQSGIHVNVVHPGYIRTNLSINALTDHGAVYGKMDETQSRGMEPSYVATCILESVALNSTEVLLAPLWLRAVCYLRNILPDMFAYAMQKRALRQSPSEKKIS